MLNHLHKLFEEDDVTGLAGRSLVMCDTLPTMARRNVDDKSLLQDHVYYHRNQNPSSQNQEIPRGPGTEVQKWPVLARGKLQPASVETAG